MPLQPLNLAVLLSGSGTTLQNLLDHIASRQLNAKIKTVIASRPNLLGSDRALKANLPSHVVDRKQFPTCSQFSHEVFTLVDQAEVDLVVLAGWLCLLELPARYHARAMNIHPALLPSFGGRGMYGRKVHEAVLAHGCKLSGCTVHFVDDAYDTGPIILQRPCPVLDDDTPDSLAHRVFEEEKIAYPQAIQLFHEGRLKIEGRRVRTLPPSK